MITDQLNKVALSPVDLYETKLGLANATTLCRMLRLCVSPADCIPILHTELTGSNRRSFIERIYGRIRTLQPSYDMAQFDLWRAGWERQKTK